MKFNLLVHLFSFYDADALLTFSPPPIYERFGVMIEIKLGRLAQDKKDCTKWVKTTQKWGSKKSEKGMRRKNGIVYQFL